MTTTAGLERFGKACAAAFYTAAFSGSWAYAASGGRVALCEASKPSEATDEAAVAADEGEEAGVDRYLAYSASLARLKVVLLKTKATLLKTAAVKGGALKGAAAGKAAAVKTAAAEGARYVAYSSDVGESMRPVLKPWMVNATYGVAVGYVFYDAGSDVRRKQLAGHDTDVLVATGAYKLTFHAICSLAIPAVLIHTAVHKSHTLFSAEAFAAFPRVVKFGPTAVGLGLIPLMPFIDEPAEHVLDAAFDAVLPKWRIGNAPHGHHPPKKED